MNWYLEVLRKYADFSGRARRREYWIFGLINLFVTLIFMAIDFLVGSFSPEAGIGLFSGIYALAVLIPSLAVAVRRLHDTGRSGWWLLISLIPLVGSIVLLIFTLLDSQPEENRFGPSPKYHVPAAALKA